MSFPLSTYNLGPLSAHVVNTSIGYTNVDRGFTDGYTISSIDRIDYRQYSSLLNIKDIAVNDNTIVFLTGKRSLSAVLNTLKTVSATMIGNSGVDIFKQYFFNIENSENNNNLDVKNQYDLNSNYLLTIPYKDSTNYNIIPLKSSQGIDYEYNYNEVVKGSISRSYDGIYLDNNNNLFCQFRTSGFPVEITNDVYNIIYIPDRISNISISALNFKNFGGNWGNSPCNSDVILLDRFGYNDHTNSGKSSPNSNGTPLCLWLSGNTTRHTSNTVWMERWYDPNRVSQGNAFITVINSSSALDPIIDKISSTTIIPKSKISYLRLGPERNKTFISNFDSNLQFHLSSWGNKIEDVPNNIYGFAIPSISDEMFTEGKFDGSLHFHIPPNDGLLIPDNLTLGMWVYQDQWDCGIDTQYFGNFSNKEGYGLFFNTGTNADLLTFPTTSGFIYGFNNKGHRVFEKSINESVGLSSSRIDYIATDLYGSRWMYDGINKNIYKLDTDDLLKKIIELPSTAVIDKMQITSQNELYILNNTTHRISAFDADGVPVASYSASGYDNFELDSDDTIHKDIANIMITDNDDNIIVALGTNIYKNGALFFNIGYKILAMNVDSNNNVWVAYNSNRLLKLDSDGNLLWIKELPVPFKSETSMELNFVKEVKNKCDVDYIWLIFNTSNYVLKLNSDGDIVRYINIQDVVNLKTCRDFFLNVKGDFTGFNTKRKYNKFSNGDSIASDNPALSIKINLRCADNRSTIELHSPVRGLTGWNHIAFSHSIVSNKTHIKLYVNGSLKESLTISGIYFIDYGSEVSPYIIGGRSGKLGATNVEVGLNNEQYFKGKINDVRIYDIPLNDFQLRGLATNLYYNNWQNMTWYIPTPERTYMEEIVGYHLNSYKGSKSNKYNIKIKNMQISDETTQNIIIDAITNSIKKFTPINTELNEIIFE